MIILKECEGSMFKYDTDKELYFNEKTNKWVKRPRNNKNKSINKKITIVKNGFNMNNFHIKYSSDPEVQERLNLFLTKVIQKYKTISGRNSENTIFDMDNIEFEKNIYSYFTEEDIECILGVKYRNIVKWLIDEKYIIKEDKMSTYKWYLHTYTPTDKLLNLKFTLSKNKTLRVYNSLVIYYKKIEKQLGEYKFMFNIMSRYNIDITEEQYINIINNKYDIKNNGNYDEYLKRNMYIFDNIMYYNKLSKYERLEFFVVDKFAGRLHSIFSRVPAECRKYIKGLDTSIDLKQSQICILSKLLLNEIGTNTFTSDTNNNDMYLLFKEKYCLDSRKDSKKFMFTILFGRSYHINKQGHSYMTKEHKDFNRMYPSAGAYITKLKSTKNELKKTHSILAQKLQQLEVDIFFNIWLELKQNKIKFICIHDELIVSEQDNEKTLLIMKKHMSLKLKGVNFELVMNKK